MKTILCFIRKCLRGYPRISTLAVVLSPNYQPNHKTRADNFRSEPWRHAFLASALSLPLFIVWNAWIGEINH